MRDRARAHLHHRGLRCAGGLAQRQTRVSALDHHLLGGVADRQGEGHHPAFGRYHGGDRAAGAQLADGALAGVGARNVGERLGVVDAQAVEDGLQRVAGLDALVVHERQLGFRARDAGDRGGQGLYHTLEQDVGGGCVGCDGRRGNHAHQRQPGHADGDPGAGTGEEMGRQIG